MLRCKICNVPLSGFLSTIPKIFFKIKPSIGDPQICNKCANEPQVKTPKILERLTGKKYQCQICGRMIHEEHSLEHIKAEEYLIELIRKDHSHWKVKDPTCKECMEYYRRLVKESEI